MRLKQRIKVALAALRGRMPSEPPKVVLIQPPEPATVVDNQLLAGKNVLITGAGRNIGRGIAIEMAKQGANIFFTDLDSQRIQHLEETLANYPITVKGFVSDVSSPEDTDRLCDALIQSETKIDVLVNNAGMQFNHESSQIFDVANSRQIFNTNVFGPLYLTQKIIKSFKEHNISGSILFITSVHQDLIFKGISYSASKAALAMLIKELALELAPISIRVNGIAPGWVAEDENGNPLPFKNVPLHFCSIQPCYIGRAAVYLASDYFSKFTTGTVIRIDAGISLHYPYNTFYT